MSPVKAGTVLVGMVVTAVSCLLALVATKAALKGTVAPFTPVTVTDREPPGPLQSPPSAGKVLVGMVVTAVTWPLTLVAVKAALAGTEPPLILLTVVAQE